jgi:hypothetical protein
VSVFDVAFHPVPVKVHENLLFLGSDSAILLYIFLFGPAIVFLLFCCPFCGLSRHLLFGLRCDILWIGICHRRMEGESRLLQRRIFFLGVRRMVGRGSRIHDDGRVKVCSRYEV